MRGSLSSVTTPHLEVRAYDASTIVVHQLFRPKIARAAIERDGMAALLLPRERPDPLPPETRRPPGMPAPPAGRARDEP